MILQPLVENAIMHGISGRSAGGTVALRARVFGGRLELQVQNDAGEELASSGAGIGLANVRERLQVHYGERQSLAFERRPGKVWVDIVLPHVPARSVLEEQMV
jgi:sensor histidine kinase YesM